MSETTGPRESSVGCPLCGAASEHTLSACLGNLAAERDRFKATLERLLTLTSTYDAEKHGRTVYLVSNWQAREMIERALRG